ncbi:ABC transporter permease [Desulfoplanes sp. PS50]
MNKIVQRFSLCLLTPALFVLIWTWIASQVDNSVIIPSVAEVLDLLARPGEDLISMGSLLTNVWISLLRVVIGYLLAVGIAVPLGIAMGYSAVTYTLFNDFLNLFRPIPPLAWVPLVMAWFGVASLADMFQVENGTWFIYLSNFKFSMIFIIFIGAFFPVLTSAVHGVKSVNKTLVDSARVLGAGETTIFCKVLLPAALPTIVNGMRIGLGIAWMCLVSAEMLPGSLAGIGYLITHAYTVASTDIVIAGMVCIGFVGAIMDGLFRYVEQKKFSWQRLSR